MNELKELIQLIDESSIDEFEYEIDNSKVVLRKNKEAVVTAVPQATVPQVATQTAVAPVATAPTQVSEGANTQVSDVSTDNQAALHKIESPMVGTFYAKPSPDKDAFVKAGSKVNDDTVVCIIEAMKLFNEIEADVKGEIVEVLVEDGQLVEYGQPLFLVRAE